jgi:hypothetical protein
MVGAKKSMFKAQQVNNNFRVGQLMGNVTIILLGLILPE